MFHQLTSFHPHCQIHHNNWVQKTKWPVVVLRKIHNHPPRPAIKSYMVWVRTGSWNLSGLKESYWKVLETNHTWCARHMRSKSWRFKNFDTTSAPNVKETPLSFSPHPCTSLSGSDHRRSQSRPRISNFVLL